MYIYIYIYVHTSIGRGLAAGRPPPAASIIKLIAIKLSL